MNKDLSKGEFRKDNGEMLSWNTMVYEFTTETTHGEMTDEQIANLSDEEFISAVEKYTDFEYSERR